MLEGENRMSQDADKPTLKLSLSFGKISAVVAVTGAAIYARICSAVGAYC
jgi:hypothetical protein